MSPVVFFFRITPIILMILYGFGCSPAKKSDQSRMIISFYMDDTNPQIVSAAAFGEFVNFCEVNGVKGESSLILGYSGKSISSDTNENSQKYLQTARTAYDRGIDSQMEIMTHHEIFDFRKGEKPDSAIHEGLWLHEPGVKEEEYYRYFLDIISEGEKAGVMFTGLTWPGCGCDACSTRYGELRKEGPLHFNPAVFTALLNLARESKFRGKVIPIFYESDETEFGAFKKASEGVYGVYDLMPNAADHFGIWENSPEHVNPDYYITEDGKSGIIVRHLENGDPYCLWYMHWQGVNPEKGVGWEAFKTVISRIDRHLKDRVVWMTPSEIVGHYHDSGGWEFIKSM
jgi:hypothetical protein